METVINILAVIGAIESALLLIGFIWAIYLWTKGISPVLYRLGTGLAKRKIAIFSTDGNATSMRQLVGDLKLFPNNNIEQITQFDDVKRATTVNASVFLLRWSDWGEQIDEVLAIKPDTTPLIVYAPHSDGQIPLDEMKKLDSHRNTTVVNFRGRLLNDVITSMITTSYQ